MPADTSVGAAFPVKGTTFRLQSGSSEIKGVLIEDPDITVGEAENNKVSASDGNSYSFVGQESENEVSFTAILAEDAVRRSLPHIYGNGTTAGTQGGTGGLLWELRSAGETTTNIFFTSPTSNTATHRLYLKAVNAKGLVATPQMPLNSGWQLAFKFTCDYFTFEHDNSSL